MKTVVITGSTRGIGLGMAQEFLKRGHQVVICGRTEDSTQKAAHDLSGQFDSRRILAQPCDMGQFDQVQTLWDASVRRFKTVDLWINNAGASNPRENFWELPLERIDSVVATNLSGVMYGSKVAIAGMMKQGSGQLYNMEGLGSNGMIAPGLILYGATKSALTYFTKGLIQETKNTPVQVGLLSPGMVVTDLLLEGYSAAEVEKSKRLFNILADKVETVAPFLVEQMLANDKPGAHIQWLTRTKAFYRFMTAPFNKRDLFAS